MFPHLTEVSPSGASRFGVRIIYNVALDLLFVSCSATDKCIELPAQLESPSTNKYAWRCNVCQHVYMVRVPSMSTVLTDPADGRPLDRWVAGWLGHDTDDVQVTVRR